MRVLKSVKSWKSIFTCSECGMKTEMFHHGCTKKEALKGIPSEMKGVPNTGVWNGWFVAVKNKELCAICHSNKMNSNLFHRQITVECRECGYKNKTTENTYKIICRKCGRMIER